MKRVSQHTIPNGLPNKPVKAKKIPQPYSPPELFTLHMLAAFIGNRGSVWQENILKKVVLIVSL